MTEPVTVGTAVIAYIEPHPGQARAFNAWYERDHFYAAAMAGPGVFAGARWVATRACKQRRTGTLFGDHARGSYLATYWLLPGMQETWDDWAARAYASIPPERLFAGRDHVHTGVYAYATDVRAPGAPPPATALDHGFTGLVVGAFTGAEAAAKWAGAVVSDAVPLVMTFASQRTIMTTTEPPAHSIVLAFSRGDPLSVDIPAGADFASPFLATVPGTDRYTDDL